MGYRSFLLRIPSNSKRACMNGIHFSGVLNRYPADGSWSGSDRMVERRTDRARGCLGPKGRTPESEPTFFLVQQPLKSLRTATTGITWLPLANTAAGERSPMPPSAKDRLRHWGGLMPAGWALTIGRTAASLPPRRPLRAQSSRAFFLIC